ncbi:MAG: EamA family transporter [Clostridia bacterium]|nr:EamA family transporter [Clostridia bacterium]
MEQIWILFTLIYALLKGSREGMKKAALKKSSANEILFFYTLIGFLCTLPTCGTAFSMPPLHIFCIFIKAAVVCAAWFCAFKALTTMSVSLYGIMDLSRMIFSTMLGVFLLGESFTVPKAIGVTLVIIGLLLANLKKDTSSKGMTVSVFIAAILNCFLNAVSGTMDKVLMGFMTSSQLQFWFMLFMTLIYGAVLLITKEKISIKTLKTNIWVPLMSISLFIGDRFLFEANANPNSQVTLMTVIKQSSVIVTVLTGWLIFKEKHILYKLMCTAIVLAGIFVALFA